MNLRRHAATAFAVLAVVTFGACGGDGEEPPSAGGGGTTSIGVTLREWSVAPAQASAPAGAITFSATNQGPAHKHELVVLKTDLAPQSLPTKADGSVDEAAAGIQSLGEIAEFAVGAPQSKTFTLAAGKYILLCNVVEDPPTADMAGIKAHYKLGMFAAFTAS